MNIKSIGPLAICAAVLSGCATTIETASLPFQTMNSPKVVPAGFVYHLPVVEVMPDAFLVIQECKIDDKILENVTDATGTKVDAPLAEVKLKVGGTLSSETVGGPRVVIDYRRLAQFLKTGSVDIERYPNGTLKTINASIADEAPEAIASIGAAVGSVYLLTVGAPVAAVGTAVLSSRALSGNAMIGAQFTNQNLKLNNKALAKLMADLGGEAGVAKLVPISYPVCTAETLKLLAERTDASDKRDDATEALETKTAALAQIVTEAGTIFTADERTRINGLRAEIKTLTASIAALDDIIKKRSASLSLRLTTADRRPPAVALMTAATPYRLTAEPDDDKTAIARFIATHFETRTLQVSPAVQAAFAKRDCLDSVKAGPNRHCGSIAAIETYVRTASDVTVTGTPLAGLKDTPSVPLPDARAFCSTTDKRAYIDNTAPALDPRCATMTVPVSPKRPERGTVAAGESIVYVEPSPYRFRLTAFLPGAAGVGGRRQMLESKTIDVPQLGTWLGLPLRADFGEKVELSATFNEAGTLTKASYKRPQSGGKAAADTLKSLAATALDTRDKVEARRAKLGADAEARRLALVTGETLEINNRIALLDARDRLDKQLHPTPATVDPDKDLKARLATATANALLEEAYLRIAVAQQGPPPR